MENFKERALLEAHLQQKCLYEEDTRKRDIRSVSTLPQQDGNGGVSGHLNTTKTGKGVHNSYAPESARQQLSLESQEDGGASHRTSLIYAYSTKWLETRKKFIQ